MENGLQNGTNGVDYGDDGKYELFGQMNTHIKNQVKNLVLNSKCVPELSIRLINNNLYMYNNK